MHADYATAVLAYGLQDPLAVIVTLAYGRIRVETDEETTHARGIGDLGLDLKWRFYEHDALSFALKPGVRFATGDADEQLGAGRERASVFFVTTFEPKPWAVHLHLGYLWNANVLSEREDLWHASLGGWLWLGERWRIVAEAGTFRNVDPDSTRHPAFAIVGAILSPREDFDLSFGVRTALSRPETDYSLLAGLTLRF